ncbi:MAG: hypothetical protein QM773_15935 [Hyphomonadaceae bacterium]
MRIVFTVVAGLVALSGCANLLTASGSAATRWANLEKSRAAKAAGHTDEGKICKSMMVMGSNFPQKVCSTQSEWDTFNEQQRKTAEEFDANRRAGNTDSAFERQ